MSLEVPGGEGEGGGSRVETEVKEGTIRSLLGPPAGRLKLQKHAWRAAAAAAAAWGRQQSIVGVV